MDAPQVSLPKLPFWARHGSFIAALAGAPGLVLGCIAAAWVDHSLVPLFPTGAASKVLAGLAVVSLPMLVILAGPMVVIVIMFRSISLYHVDVIRALFEAGRTEDALAYYRMINRQIWKRHTPALPDGLSESVRA